MIESARHMPTDNDDSWRVIASDVLALVLVGGLLGIEWFCRMIERNVILGIGVMFLFGFLLGAHYHH